MVNFCAVFNCGNRASREKEKSYFRFPGIVSNNGEEGLTLSKKEGISGCHAFPEKI